MSTINYFATLSAAINAINSGTAGATTADDSTKVEVITTAKELMKVRLLGDVSENETITVGKDIDLVLNGHTLTFTTLGAYLSFGAGTSSMIHGAGGSVVKTLETDSTDPAMLISTEGTSLRILGGAYTVDCGTSGAVLPIRATAACELLEMDSCTVTGKNSTGGVFGIQSQAVNSFVRDTRCITEATSQTYGIMSTGNVKIVDCDVNTRSSSSYSNAVRVISGSVSVEGCTLESTSEEFFTYTVYIVDGAVTVDGCKLSADTYNRHASGIELTAGSLTVRGSSITATARKGESATSGGIYTASGTTLNIKDSTILADSTPNCSDPSGNTIGIYNSGTAYLENTKVYGSNSGVQNNANAKLYVSGGTYTGYCHGGFYFAHGSGGEAFVNDATIRGGRYEGIYNFSNVPTNTRYAAAYIGGGENENNSNVTAYLDGCFFDAAECHRAMVLRGSHSEQNNTLNISNCIVTHGTLDNGTIRIDNATLKLNVGSGNNVTTAMFKNYFLYPNESGGHTQMEADYEETGVVEYTKAVYRKFP